MIFEPLEVGLSYILHVYSNHETLSNDKVNNILPLTMTFILKEPFWTLLRPGAFLFHKHVFQSLTLVIARDKHL